MQLPHVYTPVQVMYQLFTATTTSPDSLTNHLGLVPCEDALLVLMLVAAILNTRPAINLTSTPPRPNMIIPC